jgi:hypothetical protein
LTLFPPDLPSPVVSVVVAAHRSDDYLRLALRSALRQSFADLEVIVSDDADSAATRGVVTDLADPRLVYRANPRPLGPAGNHWAAFTAARGDYIAILNHDDLWEEEFLGRMVAALRMDAGLTLAFCDHHLVDEAGNRLAEATDANTRKWQRDLLRRGSYRPFPELVVRQSIPMAMGAVFRKSALPREWPDGVGPAYDLWLAYALCATGGGAYYCPDRLTSWRVHRGSLSATGGLAWSTGSAQCWREMAGAPLFSGLRPAIKTKLATACTRAAMYCLRDGDGPASRHFARQAWLARKTRLRSLAALGLSCLPPGVALTLLRACDR